MGFLPVFLELSAGPVILVGSGPQAMAKLQLLRAAGAHVRWFSPDAGVEEQTLLASHYAGHIGVMIGEPGDSDISGAIALVSAAGDEIDDAARGARPGARRSGECGRPPGPLDLHFSGDRRSRRCRGRDRHRRRVARPGAADCANGSKRSCPRASASSPR